MMLKFAVTDKKNNNLENWYFNPKMLGHDWTKKNIDLFNDMIKNHIGANGGNKKLNAIILNCAYDLNDTDWNRLSRITKKDISLLQYIFRHTKKQSPLDLLHYHNCKSGILKNQVTHILEYLCYKLNNIEYFEYYYNGFKIYGMSKSDAFKRYTDYHIGLEKRSYIQMLNSEYIQKLKK